ncbi:MAG: GNAT family N-acetyltransferase [Candidatus Micrarchaeia archaeon]
MEYIKYRKLMKKDIKKLSALIIKIYNELPESMHFNNKPTKKLVREILTSKLTLQKGLNLVDIIALDKNENVIGECEIVKKYDLKNDFYGIIGIIVDSSSRNKNIGTTLLNNAISKTSRLEIKKLVAEVSQKNKPAINFFIKNKFKEKEEAIKKVKNNDFILTFEKNL